MKDYIRLFCFSVIFFSGVAVLLQDATAAERDQNNFWIFDNWDIEKHGFFELRSGYRTQNDKYQKDMSVMEMRFQQDLYSYQDWGDVKFKGDLVGDMYTEEFDYQIREAYVFLRPVSYADMWIGRQILTWGTGDLVFINDLFPKDWQSFFIGRDSEYLKAPSDAAKVSLFHDLANLDIVFVPQFDSDNFISGERISYYSSMLGRTAGRDAELTTEKPDRWFKDYELHLRAYRNFGSYELAFYGYKGFWKSPGGQTLTGEVTFPDLNVYGVSVRGPFAGGIGNIEAGYYDSRDDQSGKNPFVKNSEFRLLGGYTREIGKNFTAGLQYYIEQMSDYGHYLDNLPSGPARDRTRHLATLRLTKLLMNQNLTLSMFTYYSPTDKDVYMRPNAHYKITDNVAVEIGGNIFFGDYEHTFFGQFRDNTNVYTAVRYSF